MPQPIPFVVYSDGPSLPTGLARIATDLCARLHAEQDALGITLLQAGWNPLPARAKPWPVYSLGAIRMEDGADWGAAELGAAWQEAFGSLDGIVLSIWDPARAWALLGIPRPSERWGYFPIDGTDHRGIVGGPAAEAIRGFNRALAYTRWGSEVIQRIRGGPAPWLPHGIDPMIWRPEHTQATLDRVRTVIQRPDDGWVLGCVATNQVRKDLAAFFATLAELRRRGEKVRGWLHTDQLVRAWSVPQLIETYGVAKKVAVTTRLDDEELSAAYSACGVTLGVGRGEGFGYPLVESLACGTPVVHGDSGGGAELIPMNPWRVPVTLTQPEGTYAIERPVIRVADWANAVQRAMRWRESEERVVQEYCRGAVAHLHWDTLWPRWRGWIRQGLEGVRG